MHYTFHEVEYHVLRGYIPWAVDAEVLRTIMNFEQFVASTTKKNGDDALPEPVPSAGVVPVNQHIRFVFLRAALSDCGKPSRFQACNFPFCQQLKVIHCQRPACIDQSFVIA